MCFILVPYLNEISLLSLKSEDSFMSKSWILREGCQVSVMPWNFIIFVTLEGYYSLGVASVPLQPLTL